MSLIDDIPVQCIHCIHQLAGVCVEIKVLEEAIYKFTEEEIVGFPDYPHALVCVAVGTGTDTEGPQSPERCSLPVLVVVGNVHEARHAAHVPVLQSLEQLAKFLLALLLLHQPHLVFLLQPLPDRMQTGAFVPKEAFVLGVITDT